jgi:hypothetical protein
VRSADASAVAFPIGYKKEEREYGIPFGHSFSQSGAKGVSAVDY